MTKIAILLKMTLGTLVITPCVTQALTTINDSNIGAYTNTGISATSDDVIIQTTTATASPQINKTTGSDALLASNGKTLTIDSSNTFVIQNNATGNYNSANGIRTVAQGIIDAKSELDINVNDGTGIYLASEGQGLFAQKVTINGTGTSANSFIGIRTYNNSKMIKTTGVFDGEVDINSTGSNSIGILSQNNSNPDAVGSNLTFNDKTTINMTGNNTNAVAMLALQGANPNAGSFIVFNNGLDATTAHGATISIEQSSGSITINSGQNENNIVSTDSSSYNAIQAIDGTINVNGKTNIKGDIAATAEIGKGVVNLTLTDGSTLLTSMDNYSKTDPTAQGEINLKMAGSNSQWKITGNSYIDSLILNDNAKVSFGYNYSTPNTITAFDDSNKMTLTTTALSGSGVFEMRTAIGSSINSDLLKVTGASQATGNHQIMINDSGAGSATVTGNEKITLVETEGGGANFTLGSQGVDVGQYRFDQLTQVKDGRATGTEDWVLTGSKSAGKPQLNDTAQNVANILNSNYLMNYVETQTLLQRMGQLRQNDMSGGDAWGRVYKGKLSSFNDKRLSNFDMDYYGLQLGVDKKIDSENGDIYYGIMGGMSQGNVDYSVGDGHTRSYYAGLYGAFQSKTGFYIDGLFKYTRMDNKFNTKTAGGYAVKGDGDTNGFSLGVELGQRFYLSSMLQNEGWYLEPQGQLTYSHQGSATIKATNGLRTQLDSYNSLLSRVSMIAGYTIVNSENPIDVYFKTGYVKEFDGDTAYTFNHTNKEKYDFGGNWWDNGIGINMQLNKQHNFYADVVYSVGNKFDQKQINMGYRYSF